MVLYPSIFFSAFARDCGFLVILAPLASAIYSLFLEIARNKAKSILLMAVFCAIFFLIMYVFVIFLGGGPFAIAAGAAVILLYAAFSYFAGDKIILKMSGAKKADPAQYPVRLQGTVGSL